MDIKFKIIIIIFVIIAIFYAAHFFINNFKVTKSESFTLFNDDVEHYKDPPKSKFIKSKFEPKSFNKNKDTKSHFTNSETISDETKYDLRVLILDDIESLQIADKNVKGELMEVLFSENTLTKLAPMSDIQRSKFIQGKYDELLEQPVTKIETESESETKTKSKTKTLSEKSNFEEPIMSQSSLPKPASISPVQISKDILSKTNDAMKRLKLAQDSITEIEQYANSLNVENNMTTQNPSSKKDAFMNMVASSGIQSAAPKITEKFTNQLDSIEGFENVRSYAPIQ